MGIKRANYRVIVEPDLSNLGGYITTDREGLPYRLTEKLMKNIKRHVDDIYDISITSDQVCEHCENLWTEKDVLYNGGCCDEDEKNNPELPEGK